MRANHARLITLPVSFLDSRTFVEFLFALANTNLELDLAIFPIHRNRDNCVALSFDRANQTGEFAAMQQQLAPASILGDVVG